jgi:hypothetical protein
MGILGALDLGTLQHGLMYSLPLQNNRLSLYQRRDTRFGPLQRASKRIPLTIGHLRYLSTIP